MRYLSLFSGIEAASVAWRPLGWECVGVAEIEPFPCKVLVHHYPDVPNLGSVTEITDEQVAALGHIDLVVGGFPCQDLSVAGKRAGMEEGKTRSGLFYDAMRIVHAARQHCGTRFLLIENVPGLLSSRGGGDFASLVGEMAGAEFGIPRGRWQNTGVAAGAHGLVEWCVLDAQWFGVAQRRKRVFALADFGDWAGRSPILFERDSLSGNPAPRREAGERIASALTDRADRGGTNSEGQRLIPQVSPALKARDYKGPSSDGDGDGAPLIPCVARSLRGEGFDASEDDTGRGTPLVPVAFHNRQDPDISGDITHPIGAKDNGMGVMFNAGGSHGSKSETNANPALCALQKEIGAQAFAEWGLGILDSLQSSPLLRQAMHGCGVRHPAFTRRWVVYHALSREEDHAAGIMQSLREVGSEGCPPQGWEPSEQLSRELGAYLSGLSQPGAQAERLMHDLWKSDEGVGVLRQTLSAFQEMGQPHDGEGKPAHGGAQVRRLTVEECEFLQGFPRSYTDIRPNGKPTPDGPRYKALGNSMAVPVMAWIGQRIQQVSEIASAQEGAA